MEKLTLGEFGQTIKLQYPEYRGMSDEEIGGATLEKFPEYQDRIKEETGFIADLKGIGTGIKESFNDAVSSVDASQNAQAVGEQTGFDTFKHTLGQTAGFISDSIGETIMGGVKALTPQPIQEGAGKAVGAVAEKVIESAPAQDVANWYTGLEEKQQRDVDASLGGLGLVLDVAGGFLVKAPLKNAVTQTLDKTAEVAKAGAKAVDETIAPVVTATKDAVAPITETVANVVTDIPRRIGTNIDNAKATREAVEALPTEQAKVAVRDGIDILDVKKVFQTVDPTTQTKFKELHKVVKEFEAGTSKTNPIEMVGKPLVSRLKDLDGEMTRVGQNLSKIADDLGEVTAEEAQTAILNRLKGGVAPDGSTIKGVRGMEGLKVGDDGLLDFSDTVLASGLSKADQKAIQEIFQEATSAGTGKSKHLLRQELFEILNGKKASLQNMTGTQENAFNAVRKGLSDVLDGKNDLYKSTNQEYAKLATPVTEMRKMMKQLDPDIDEDILDMSAGLLARRLTSNSATNPKIRLLLRQIDDATAVKGQTTLSVEELQDFYNILEKYYDIAGKTGFQAQVTSALEKGGITNVMADKLRSLGGRSDAVRQKALEDLISDAYGQ